MSKKQKKILTRILLSTFLILLFAFLPVCGMLKSLLYLLPYIIIGYDILTKAFKGILNRQPFDENFLMAVATIGAIILGEYVEGAAVMLFYQVGELFQSYAVGKSRRNISKLMDIRPDYAHIENENGEIIKVDPFDVTVGSSIVVKPGEKIPIDGIVLSGSSTLNTSALTGESLPKDVSSGDEVLSGCINLSGLLKIKTTKEFAESTVSKILELVENATSKKSKSEKFISKFAKYYTPIVCYSSILLAFIPPIIRILFLCTTADWSSWIYRALTFLVISCPCALVISIPLGFFAGIGGASNSGVLIKGSNYLETLSKVKCVVFDKTGTITKGVFEVVGIHHNTVEEKKLLEYAALAEYYSDHPISKSLKAAYGCELDTSRVKDVNEISGHGITATVDNINVAVGNSKLMQMLDVKYIPCSHTGTAVHVSLDGNYAGHILISDVVKPDALSAVSALKKHGIIHTVMLTGDLKPVAESIAEKVGIDEVYSELLPEDKVYIVEKLLKESNDKYKLAFLGDGINDAPALMRSDVGIAMGAFGSDAAIEAADIVLMDDNPLKVVKAIKISKKCMRIVYQNIIFAIGIKLICLILGMLGIANMWFAIFADVGVMILAVINAIRSLYVKNL